MSTSVFAAPKCYDENCVGDKVINPNPSSASNIIGELIDMTGVRTFTIRWQNGNVVQTESIWMFGLGELYKDCGRYNGLTACKETEFS